MWYSYAQATIDTPREPFHETRTIVGNITGFGFVERPNMGEAYLVEKGTMATDYDAPRKSDEEMSEDSIEELKTRRNDKNSGKVDEDEVEAAEAFELPGADLSHEELTVRVLPRQQDEFTCASCFLVRHRSQIAEERNGQYYCLDCAG